ncbi:MAG: hypothetical protein R6X15_09810 [Pseudomonadota bacterium]
MCQSWPDEQYVADNYLRAHELLSPLTIPANWVAVVTRGEGMYTRHDEVPVYTYRDGVLDALHYNHVQVALNRLGESLRITLPKLQTLDLILQRDAWIIVDRTYNDLPIAAWTNFDKERREGLHEPVHCQIRLFVPNAGVLLKRVLEAMEMLLGELEVDEGSHEVIKFPGKE